MKRPSGSTIAHSSIPSPERRTQTAGGASHNGTASAVGAPSNGDTRSAPNAAAPPITAPASRDSELVDFIRDPARACAAEAY